MCPCENMAEYMEHLLGLASLLDKQEVQDICGHTALRARKWSGFICKRASEDTTLSRYIGLLKKEEERRTPNRDFFFTLRGAYVNLRYIAMLYTHSIGNQP